MPFRTGICVYCFAALAASETWPGYQGGHTHRNSTPQAVVPEGLHLLWRSELPAPTRQVARNLVVTRGLVFLAANAPDAKGNAVCGQIELRVLSAATGATAARLRTHQVNGGHSNNRYPTGMLTDGRDALWGHTSATWDEAAEVIYLRGSGDNAWNTAYRPFANQADWKTDDPVDGFPLHPSLAQAALAKAEANQGKWFVHIDEYGRNTHNISCFLELDPQSPFIWTVGEGHTQAGDPGMFIRRDNGTTINVPPKRSGWMPTNDAPGLVPSPDHRFGGFRFWRGVMQAGGRCFAMGPGDDCDGDGTFGNACGFGFGTEPEDQNNWPKGLYMDSPDQGLFLGAWDAASTGDTLVLKPAWAYRLHSPHIPPKGPAEAESYLETDGFFRPKAWCWDGAGGVWAAWKPTRAGGMQLLHAGSKGLENWDTPLGAGAMGQDVWPRIAATGNPGHETIALLAANAVHRPYLCVGPCFGVIRAWAEEAQPPASPNALTVFDAASRSIRWTYPFTTAPWIPPPHDSVGWQERTHLVVAGRWAWVGWVDATASGEAQVRLVAFNLDEAKPEPRTWAFPLGFAAGDYPASSLTDLVACDGRLFALMLRAKTIYTPNATQTWGGGGPGDWDAQIVIALQP
jgi:hypothetical protein